jgi:hypothetical protein
MFEGPSDVSGRDDVGIREGEDGDTRTIADAAIGETCITRGYRSIDLGSHDASPYLRAHSITSPSTTGG